MNAYDDEKVKNINQGVKSFCMDNQIVFLDAYSMYIDKSGRVKRDLYYDYVHPNLKGYLLLADLIMPKRRQH